MVEESLVLVPFYLIATRMDFAPSVSIWLVAELLMVVKSLHRLSVMSPLVFVSALVVIMLVARDLLLVLIHCFPTVMPMGLVSLATPMLNAAQLMVV